MKSSVRHYGALRESHKPTPRKQLFWKKFHPYVALPITMGKKNRIIHLEVWYTHTITCKYMHTQTLVNTFWWIAQTEKQQLAATTQQKKKAYGVNPRGGYS